MSNEYFDRERLAGYDRDVLENACVALVGCGAGANNAAQCLALAGVREFRFIDFDHIEPSNLTRSPLFAHLRARAPSHRANKAKELALAVLQLSYAENSVVRYAPDKFEALGLGALQGCDVVIAGVDNAGVRARLAEATALLGIPMVEAGFSGLRGNVSAYANRSPDEPCYGCLNPHATPERVSCQTYATAVTAEGRVPATQTMAALTGSLVAETVIRFLHHDYELSGRVFTLDATNWRTFTLNITRDPECRRAHRRINAITPVSVSTTEPVAKIFQALPQFEEPELFLPDAYIAAMPCLHCGARIRVAKPEWAVSGAPQCRTCNGEGSQGMGDLESFATVTPSSPLANLQCHRLGLGPLSIFEVYDHASGVSCWAQLGGSIDDLFVTRRREEKSSSAGNPVQIAGMNPSDSDAEFQVIAG